MSNAAERVVHHLPLFHTDSEAGIVNLSEGESPVTLVDVLPITLSYRRYLNSLGLDYGEVNVYLDGLPALPGNNAYPRDGWLNGVDQYPEGSAFETATELVQKGASIYGIENPILLKRFDKLLSEAERAEKVGNQKVHQKKLRDVGALVAQRDQIGARIVSSTLTDRKVGVLLLGGDHDTGPYARRGLKVVTSPEIATLVRETSARLMNRPPMAS